MLSPGFPNVLAPKLLLPYMEVYDHSSPLPPADFIQTTLNKDFKKLDWARICKTFKEPRNRFPAWRAGTTTLFDVPARQAT
jgi:hypothetical protein